MGGRRHEGFRAGLHTVSPDAEATVVSADWGSASAREAVLPLLRSLPAGERLGVFACTDEMAAGVYGAAAAAGRGIPEDVLVVGLDDLRGARWLTPPLTTVRQPIREMAAAAVDALAEAADGGALPTEPIVLRTRLVTRGSS